GRVESSAQPDDKPAHARCRDLLPNPVRDVGRASCHRSVTAFQAGSWTREAGSLTPSNCAGALALGRLATGDWRLATGSSFLRHRQLRLALLDHPQEGIDQGRVELASALSIDFPKRAGYGQRRLVR